MAEQHIHAEYDCQTGETTFRALTTEEVAEVELKAQQYAAERAAQEEAAEAKAALKESAKAKLIAGEPLTAEEAEVIVL